MMENKYGKSVPVYCMEQRGFWRKIMLREWQRGMEKDE